MSLRAKLALAAATLAIGAVAAVTLVSSNLIQQRLSEEVDRSLGDAVARADLRPVLGGLGPRIGPGGRAAVQLGDVGVTLLGPDGRTTAEVGTVTVPIADRDRADAVAAAARAPRPGSGIDTIRFDTVRLDGEDLRRAVATVPGGGAVVAARPLRAAGQLVADLRLRTAVLGVVVALLAAVAAWWFTRRALAPLDRLERATAAVGESGGLPDDLPAAGSDEIGRLAGSFRRMVERLERSREQQRTLVEDAGHELRTPLTSLRVNLDVLERHRDLDERERERIVADLKAETDELAQLTNEIVAVAAARHDSGVPVTTDLMRTARRVARRAQRRTGRSVEVVVHPREDDNQEAWTVPVVPDQVERAMSNLLDNALKFDRSTSERPQLVVGAGADEIAIEVRDRGPGIPVGEQERIFDRFHRTDEARSAPGSGLGLSIVAGVAAAHGGRVWARNRDGGGAVVGFSVART